MPSAKAEALETISRLPDDSDMDEIMYRLYVLKKVRDGRESARTKPLKTTEELRREAETW